MLSHALRAAVARNVSFSLVASDGAVSSSLVLPASIQQGNLLIIYNHSYNNSSTIPTAATPSGFTQIYNQSLSTASKSARAIGSYKVANGTEGGTTITGMSGAVPVIYVIVYSTNSVAPNVTLLYTGIGGGASMTNANPTDYTLSLSGRTKPVVAVGACYNETPAQISFSTTPDTQIPATDSSYRFAPKVFNTSPSNFSVTAGDGGNLNFNAAYAFEVS